jgi:hypothetical protein
LAVNQLSGGASPYMPLMFMKREKSFRRYYTLQEASEAELKRWKDAFMYFAKKLQLASGRGSHSSTFWPNVSAYCGRGGASRGCLGCVQEQLGVVMGSLGCILC